MNPTDSNSNYPEILQNFGLTATQGRLYLAIVRAGLSNVGRISKVSKVRREEVYRNIPKLEKLGLIERVLGTPQRFRAFPVEEALSRIIQRQKESFNQKTNELKAQKDTLMKHLDSKWSVPSSEEYANFALVLQRDQIINKLKNLINESQKEINISTAADLLFNLLSDTTPSLESALSQGVKLRMIVDMPETMKSLLTSYYPRLQELESEIGSFGVRFTDQSSGHYLISDHSQAMICTSPNLYGGIKPYLWTNDGNLVGIMQTNFEETWHSSLRVDEIQTSDLSEKATKFAKALNLRDHVIFIYQSLAAKREVLFSYLKAGLENDYAVVYVASEEAVDDIKDKMVQFGIEVEKNMNNGALQILDYTDVYVVNGRFEIPTTMSKWEQLQETASKKFKGLRVTGETSCFFKHGLVEELIEYERSLHKVLDLPMVAICAYNIKDLGGAKNPIDLYTELVRVHGAVLFAGVDDELGKLEIRA